MDENTKQKGGLTLIGGLFAVVAAALILLGTLGPLPGLAVMLSIVVILVTSGIAATLNTMKQSRAEGKRSARERTAAAIIAGLFVISIGAMLVLVALTEPLELIKAALGGVIVLAGAGVAAVLAMRRSDAAQETAERGAVEAQAARVNADTARAKAEESAAEGAAARNAAERSATAAGAAHVEAETVRLKAEERAATPEPSRKKKLKRTRQ